MTASSPASAAADPSMEEILASIRRILNEEDANGAPAKAVEGAARSSSAPSPAHASPAHASPDQASPTLGDVFALDQSMLVEDPPPIAPHAVLPTPEPMAGSRFDAGSENSSFGGALSGHASLSPAGDASPEARAAAAMASSLARGPALSQAPLELNAFAIPDADLHAHDGAEHSTRMPPSAPQSSADTSFQPAFDVPHSEPAPSFQPHHSETAMSDSQYGNSNSSFGHNDGGQMNNGPMNGGQNNGSLVAPEASAAASNSVGTLLRKISADRAAQISKGGPTIEDAVREEMRPLLKSWLDSNLPSIVEKLVRAEIDRVVHNAMN